jgi:hypothetical protein
MSWQSKVEQRQYRVVKNGTDFDKISRESEVRKQLILRIASQERANPPLPFGRKLLLTLIDS